MHEYRSDSLGKRCLLECSKTFWWNTFSLSKQKSHYVYGVWVEVSFLYRKSGHDQRDKDLWRLINCNFGHNILEFYNVLVEIRLTTSKTKRGIKYSKLSIRGASRVAEWLKILGNKEMLGKSQIWVETLSAQSPFQKLNFGKSIPKKRKSRYQTFLDLSSFTRFLYFVPNILSRTVALSGEFVSIWSMKFAVWSVTLVGLVIICSKKCVKQSSKYDLVRWGISLLIVFTDLCLKISLSSGWNIILMSPRR